MIVGRSVTRSSSDSGGSPPAQSSQSLIIAITQLSVDRLAAAAMSASAVWLSDHRLPSRTWGSQALIDRWECESRNPGRM